MLAIHWFRSDLRLRDNRSLEAAARADALVPLFVLDDRLLRGSRSGARRARFLLGCLERLDADLRARGQQLVVRRGDPERVIPRLCAELRADSLHFGRDYGPFAAERDESVARAVEKRGTRVFAHKDRVVFESGELRTRDGSAFRVYTPFRNAWWEHFSAAPEAPSTRCTLPAPPPGVDPGALPDARALGIPDDDAELPTPGEDAARRRLRGFLEKQVGDYAERRDLPAADGTSRLSPYLRWGALSVRLCIDEAQRAATAEPRLRAGVRKWIDELIWRDFYHAILSEHPRVVEGSFRSEYDALEWNDDEAGFRAWCEGRTGYPFVDAGMRQLAATGWMHNRVRMVVASFLTKDLLIDWRQGERFFMQQLVDGDLASNNGGWQWSASTGTDAQPYFRIFNPVSQGERFDPDGEYVRRWLPELAGLPGKRAHRPWDSPLEAPHYPPPRVSHAERRPEALKRFEAVRRGGRSRTPGGRR